ncbi:MAG: ATP-binding protein [Nitrospinae bacterium]|nr:ATP-binding protein [Nitrospinota bacterium]
MNILSNAIKFTKRGGVVTIFQSGPKTVAVSDTGVGVSEALLPNLFRHDVKTTGFGAEGEAGTGLGLPYCMDVMRAHGGGIRVGTGPGGTVFFLDFPPESPVLEQSNK